MRQSIEDQFRRDLIDPEYVSARRRVALLGMLTAASWIVCVGLGYGAMSLIF